MLNFPSSIRFASFLTYSPRDLGEEQDKSRIYAYAVKNDGFVRGERFIPMVAKYISDHFTELPFNDFLGSDVLAIPMPKSSLIAKDALWSPLQICKALTDAKLVSGYSPCLKRCVAIRKSSSSPRNRPSAHEHFESLGIDSKQIDLFERAKRVLIVDDVVTRGASFMGAYPHVQTAFSKLDIKCFAYVSTRGFNNFTKSMDPVQGSINFQFDSTDRRP